VRYREPSRVRRVIPAIAACAPISKSGRGERRWPPARRYFTKLFPARKPAWNGRASRRNVDAGRASFRSSILLNRIDTSA